MRFFTDLAARIAETPEADPTTLDKVAPGERDTGVRLSADLLRFFALIEAIRTGLNEKIKEHGGDGDESHKHDPSTCEAFYEETFRMLQEHDNLENVFWAAVKHEAGYPKEDVVGVREGGVIVAFDKKPRGPVITAITMPLPGDIADLLGLGPRKRANP